MAIALGKTAAGAQVAFNRLNLDQWLRRWLQDDVQGSVRPRTHHDYTGIVNGHLVPHLGKVKLTLLKPEHIARLHRALLDEGLSEGRVLKIHRVLSRSLKVAQRWGYVDRNVAELVSPPRVAGKEMEYFDSTEVKKLTTWLTNKPDAARWYLALLGMRQAEVLGLRWQDIDLDGGALRVQVTLQRHPGNGFVLVEPKSRASRRALPLYPQLIQALRVRRVQQSQDRLKAGDRWSNVWDLVFTTRLGRPFEAKVDNAAWKEMLAAAGLRQIRLHDARHTAGTLLLISGVPTRAAMEWLGHSQVSLTMRYTHVVPKVARDTSARLGAAMFGDG